VKNKNKPNTGRPQSMAFTDDKILNNVKDATTTNGDKIWMISLKLGVNGRLTPCPFNVY